MNGLYTMSQKEINRLEVIQKLLDKQWKQEKAAQVLHISIRQVQRLLQTYRTEGSLGLLSKKRGKPSNHRLPETLKEAAIQIIKTHYTDFGPTLSAEKLFEKHGINLSVETVRDLMIKANLWTPRNKKQGRSFQPRYRRERFGELIQIDGSTHHWFESRGPKCSLLVFVDDATSHLTSLYFAPSEAMHTYFLATKQHITRYGKPVAFYSDKFSVFKVNAKTNQNTIMTQFGRALYELNIDLLCANTCQAKGRVERANLTLQDRLVKELRLRNISTISEANAYLPEFIEDYNNRFGKIPLENIEAHRALQGHENLDEVLCFKREHTVSYNLTIQYDRVLYLIEDTEANRSLRRKKITLHEYPDGSISLNYNNQKLQFKKLYDRVCPIEQGRVVPSERIASTLELIKAQQKEIEKTYKRSNRYPRKRHLEAPTHQLALS